MSSCLHISCLQKEPAACFHSYTNFSFGSIVFNKIRPNSWKKIYPHSIWAPPTNALTNHILRPLMQWPITYSAYALTNHTLRPLNPLTNHICGHVPILQAAQLEQILKQQEEKMKNNNGPRKQNRFLNFRLRIRNRYLCFQIFAPTNPRVSPHMPMNTT